MPKLWELTNELNEIKLRIEDNDDVLDDDLEFMLDQCVGGIEQKVSGIGRLLNWCQAQKRNAEHFEEQFKKSRKVYEATIARLESYVTRELQRADLSSIQDEDGAGTWEITFTKGETVPRDFSKIPDDFIRITRDVDRVGIRKVIDQGLLNAEDVGIEIVKKAKLKFKVHKAIPKPKGKKKDA